MSKISTKLMQENEKVQGISMEDLEASTKELSTDEKIGAILDQISSISRQIKDLRSEMGNMYQALYDTIMENQNR